MSGCVKFESICIPQHIFLLTVACLSVSSVHLFLMFCTSKKKWSRRSRGFCFCSKKKKLIGLTMTLIGLTRDISIPHISSFFLRVQINLLSVNLFPPGMTFSLLGFWGGQVQIKYDRHGHGDIEIKDSVVLPGKIKPTGPLRFCRQVDNVKTNKVIIQTDRSHSVHGWIITRDIKTSGSGRSTYILWYNRMYG